MGKSQIMERMETDQKIEEKTEKPTRKTTSTHKPSEIEDKKSIKNPDTIEKNSENPQIHTNREKSPKKPEKSEKNIEKLLEKADIRNPLSVMKNYTRQLAQKRSQRVSTPQKMSSPKKTSESPKKNQEKTWGTMTDSVILIRNFEDSLSKTLENVLNNESGRGTPIVNMKNCEFCGRMFPESFY